MTQLDEKPTEDAEPSSANPPRWRVLARRISWRWVAIVVAVLLALGVVGTGGAGYYFAGVLLTVDHTPEYPVTVETVNGNQVQLSRDSDTERSVVLGLVWADGAAKLGPAIGVNGDHVTRTVTEIVRGTLKPGTKAAIDYNLVDSNPKEAWGLDFNEVEVTGELGEMPAWFVPATVAQPRSTWVIAVHGRNATRHEPLRILPALASAGLPTLVMTYRNDEGAPSSSDGYYHLGDTEWRDVVSGMAYAKAHGATSVVLYGWSMGGGMMMTALRRMSTTEDAFVRGVILDSPAMSWSAVIDQQAANRSLPGPITWSAKLFTEWRGGFDLDDLDQIDYAPKLHVPTLIFVDDTDHTVPIKPAQEFAKARPDLVTLVTTSGGGHVSSWNANPSRYEDTVQSFLRRVVQT